METEREISSKGRENWGGDQDGMEKRGGRSRDTKHEVKLIFSPLLEKEKAKKRNGESEVEKRNEESSQRMELGVKKNEDTPNRVEKEKRTGEMKVCPKKVNGKKKNLKEYTRRQRNTKEKRDEKRMPSSGNREHINQRNQRGTIHEDQIKDM